MKKVKLFLLLTLLVLCVYPLQAKKVDVKTAETVALNYLGSSGVRTMSAPKLTLVHTETKSSKAINPFSLGTNSDDVATFYVFSKGDNQGFIIISADDVAIPVLGNSGKGNYDIENLPPNFAYWMESLSQEITFALDNQLPQDSKTQAQWDNYLNGSTPSVSTRNGGVRQLLSTEWDQHAPYNDECPEDPEFSGFKSVTGCVATAMAQIMKFHAHPKLSMSNPISGYTTEGKKSVGGAKFNIPEIPAANIVYDWDNMEDSYDYVTDEVKRKAVAKLMYHCGVSVMMDYAAIESGAVTKYVGGALCDYFDYDRGVQYLERTYYNKNDWESILRAEIDAGRPVLYSGRGSGGHAFICDGYYNDEFHFNWGWGGAANGDFATNALNPHPYPPYNPGINFNNDQAITIGLMPDEGNPSIPDIRMGVGCITAAISEVGRGIPFTVTSPFVNNGLFDFSGDFGIALMDENDNLIDIIGQLGWTVTDLHSGERYTSLEFKYCMVPATTYTGNYFIRAVVKANGSLDWHIVTGPVGEGACPDKLLLAVKGDTSIWKQDAANSSWNTAGNWIGGVPKPISDVIIRKADNYPILTSLADVSTILFDPGAELGRQDLLTYGKAFVEYDFGDNTRSDRYRMLSVPLMEAYPGDFTFGNEPTVYVQTLQVTNGIGEWVTAAGGTTGKFSAGTGFVISLLKDEDANKGLGLTGGILQLPFYDNPNVAPNVHWNHSFSGETSVFLDPAGNELPYSVLRSSAGHTLAGSTASVATGFGTIGESPFALVGNPFMTTIDFNALQSANSTLIKKSYHLWTEDENGVGYMCYNPDGMSGIINPLLGLNNRIAPLQGFIVEQNTDIGDLEFDLVNMASGMKATLRSAQETKDKLSIIATNNKVSVLTYIAKREDGTAQFGERDSRKLMNGLSLVPEVYTLKQSDNDPIAVGANITNSDNVEYPLGLATTFEGEITFTFSGMDSYDAQIFFIDELLDETIALTGMATYEYIFDYTPPQHGAEIISTEDRFYIRIITRLDDETGDETDVNVTGDETSNEITGNQSIIAYARRGTIYAASDEENIQEISVYSLQGVVLYQSIVNDTSHTTTKKFTPGGMYIVNIKTDNRIVSKKVIISQYQ